MSMVSGCGLMVERLTEIKRTGFDSLKASPIFLVVCAERRRQQAVNLLHWKHRGFDSLHYHYHARNSRKIGYPRVSSEGSTPSSSVSLLGAVPWCLHGYLSRGVGVIGNILGLHPGATRSSLVPSTKPFSKDLQPTPLKNNLFERTQNGSSAGSKDSCQEDYL